MTATGSAQKGTSSAGAPETGAAQAAADTAQVEDGTAAQAATARGRSSTTREKVTAALLAAAGAGLILASDSRAWADGTVTSPVRLSVEASGSSLTSLPYALGLAGLAGAVALFAVRRIGRYLVGAVLATAGLGTVAVVAANLGKLDGTTLARAAAQTVGTAGAQIGDVTNTAWPYVTIVGGVLIALGGILTLARGRSWSGLSNRYEVAPASKDTVPKDTVPKDTVPKDTATPGKAGGRNTGAHGADVKKSEGTEEPSARDLWDALNRGTDPTL